MVIIHLLKNYKKLTIPEDSAWNRKGVLQFLWRKTHWRIRYFLGGIKNIFRWMIFCKDKNEPLQYLINCYIIGKVIVII